MYIKWIGINQMFIIFFKYLIVSVMQMYLNYLFLCNNY